MEPKTKYIIDKGNVMSVYDLGDDDFVWATDIFKLSNTVVFDDRMDAMYYKLILDLQKGKSLDNFKSSKYYNYYIERLKSDNPEYII